MKKVSIITVCFNAAATIEQTIQSVINQSYGIENIEYIVIDGESKDGTIDIINKYRDKISYFVSEPDKGIYDAMNKGISVATGEIIGVLNSDDWYDVQAIENVALCFEENETDIVYGNIKRVEIDETISGVKKAGLMSDIWYFMTIWHPAVFVKKEIYMILGGFAKNFMIAADYEFILRCYSKKVRFTYLDKELTYFRSAGVSNIKHMKCAEETNSITLMYMDRAPDKKRVLEENDYRIKAALFRQKCDTKPQWLVDVVPEIRKNRIVVWGVGIWGRTIVTLLQNTGITIDYLVDSDIHKVGSHILGIEIKDYHVLENSSVFIIIAVRRNNIDVGKKLEKLGIGKDQYLFLEEWMTITC